MARDIFLWIFSKCLCALNFRIVNSRQIVIHCNFTSVRVEKRLLLTETAPFLSTDSNRETDGRTNKTTSIYSVLGFYLSLYKFRVTKKERNFLPIGYLRTAGNIAMSQMSYLSRQQYVPHETVLQTKRRLFTEDGLASSKRRPSKGRYDTTDSCSIDYHHTKTFQFIPPV